MKKGIRTFIILFTMITVLLTTAIPAFAATNTNTAKDKTYKITLKNGKKKTVTGHHVAKVEKQIVKELNKYRKQKGARTLKTTKALTKASDIRARESAYKFSHTRPNGKKCFSVSKKLRGENLAYGFETAKDVMNAWKNSPSHDDNMRYKKFKTVAVSVFAEKTTAADGTVDYTYYMTQSFGY